MDNLKIKCLWRSTVKKVEKENKEVIGHNRESIDHLIDNIIP